MSSDRHPEQNPNQPHTESGSPGPVASYLCLLTAAAFWGASGIWVKYIALATKPSAAALAFWRDFATFAALLIIALLFCPQKLKIKPGSWLPIIGMGASLGGFHIVYNLGVMLNGVSITTVQQAAMPAFVALGAYFLWAERLSWIKLAAITLTFGGTIFTTDLIKGVPADQLSFWGIGVGFFTPLLYAAWSLFGKQIGQHYHPVVVLVYAFGLASLILLPIQPFVTQPSGITQEAIGYFCGLILISSVGAFLLFITGLGGVPSSIASIIVMSEIAFVLLYAYVLLGEVLDSGQVLGALLVLSGVLIIMRRQKR
jgi:DME family drug/metabolite transporter